MSSTATPSTSDGRAPVRVLADNLMRRALRISDPGDVLQVANGLTRAYPTQGAALNLEILGYPVTAQAPTPAVVMQSSMATRELDEAGRDIDQDLLFLTTSSQLKEVRVELASWGEVIRSALADGSAAAVLALDPGARDRTFAARRTLLDYARIARLVGTLTPGLSIPYRRFARSLDEAASLLIVSLGEALAQIGFSGDRLLLQAPASELGARADAAVAALQTLAGLSQTSYTQSDFAYGLLGYRELLLALETSGHGDLRVLLQENGLRALTGELIDRAASVDGDGLRALAATQVVTLERIERLLVVAAPFRMNSPPLSNFLSALELFADAFNGGNAGRLIALGRPVLAASGLYSIGGPDPATRTLMTIVFGRSALAQVADCLPQFDVKVDQAGLQFALDSALYAVDLAIDLYALGSDPNGVGVPEKRASAFGFLFQQDPFAGATLRPLQAALNTPWAGSDPGPEDKALLTGELMGLAGRHSSLIALVSALTPGCYGPADVMTLFGNAVNEAISKISGHPPADPSDDPIWAAIPPPLAVSVAQIARKDATGKAGGQDGTTSPNTGPSHRRNIRTRT